MICWFAHCLQFIGDSISRLESFNLRLTIYFLNIALFIERILMNKFLLDPVYDLVSIQKSHIHGFGLFARADIAKGSFLGVAMIKKRSASLYLDHLVEGYGTQSNDAWMRVVGARFINHAIKGNVAMNLVDGVVIVRAIQDIAKGEEITTNYIYLYQQINVDIPEFCVA